MRQGWLLPVVLLALAGCTSAPPLPADGPGERPAPLPGRGAIAGLLVDDVYRPVPGGLVLLRPLGHTATTDANGQFAFLDLPPGAYVLVANAVGHEAPPLTVDVAEGLYTEAHIPAQRLFSEGSHVVTTRYSVFINCAASAFYAAMIAGCVPDGSGDSHRIRFDFDDEPFGTDARAIVLEMLASQPDGYGVSVYCNDSDGYLWTEGEGDYLRVVMRRNATAEEEGKVSQWSDRCHKMSAILWYLGSDPGGTRQGGLTPWGAGARVAIKATFLVSVFVGEPEMDLLAYGPLRPADTTA